MTYPPESPTHWLIKLFSNIFVVAVFLCLGAVLLIKLFQG